MEYSSYDNEYLHSISSTIQVCRLSLVKDMYPRNDEHVCFLLGLASYWDLTTANLRQSAGHSSFVKEDIAVMDIDEPPEIPKRRDIDFGALHQIASVSCVS